MNDSGARRRLDQELVERGMAETRSRARALIMAGDILVNDKAETRAGALVAARDLITMREKPRFVSRGGEKLAHALDAFRIDPTGWACADLGASTGGFTDCLLQHGAARVYAVDVGYGQIDQRLRHDPRVVVMERVNARHLESLPELVDLVVIDVSFISLALILPVAKRLLQPEGRCVALIKPQFEAGRGEVGKGGVVKDPAVHHAVIERVATDAEQCGFGVVGLVASPLLGPAGNREFLGLFVAGTPSTVAGAQISEVVEQ